jgi:DNA-binding MarR family transcriptional regulator
VTADEDEASPPPGTEAGQSLVTSTTMLLIAAGRSAQRDLEAALAGHGVTLRHLGTLGHLAHTPGLSYSDLARRADVTVQSMHATIASLVDLGAIEVDAPERGRAAKLRLTGTGHHLLRTAAVTAREIDRARLPHDLDHDALRAYLRSVVHRRGGAGRPTS